MIVFISYSHDDDVHQSRVDDLAARLSADGFECVLDQRLSGFPPEGWASWSQRSLERADAVIVVCSETYRRRFDGEEEPGVGLGASWEAALIKQILYEAGARNRKFFPVTFERSLEIVPLVLRSSTIHHLFADYDRMSEALRIANGRGAELEKSRRRHRSADVDLTHLPTPSVSRLFGRDDILEQLERALEAPDKSVVSLIAPGGTGKSAILWELVNRLAPGYRGAAKVFAWSFYSQGAHHTHTASTAFLDTALSFFGYLGPPPISDERKAIELAKLAAEQRVLLILDGVEPLQHPPHIQNGWFRDAGLRVLLSHVARHGLGGGLVLVSSRQPLVELESFPGHTRIAVGGLAPRAGKDLLAHLGVRQGTEPKPDHPVEDELIKASVEYQGHALALVLLGRLLVREHQGDILRRFRLQILAAAPVMGQAERILAYYDAMWHEALPEKLLIYLLSLFDRPAAEADLQALIARADFAAPLRSSSEAQRRAAMSALTEAALVGRDGIDRWDSHPLIREYFNRRLRAEHPAAFQNANDVLFEHFRARSDVDEPTLEELEPLVRAVHHGCLAGRYKRALDDVYYPRIIRDDRFYIRNTLGAYATNLFIVSCFFDEDLVSPVTADLDASDRAWLVSEASITLMSLGRPADAVPMMATNLDRFAALGEHDNIAVTYENIVDSLCSLGRFEDALRHAQAAIEPARAAGWFFREVIAESRLGAVLCFIGRTEEGLDYFRRAEERLRREDGKQYLTSFNGYLLVSILLDLEPIRPIDQEDLRNRVELALQVARKNEYILDQGLDLLNRARLFARDNRYVEAEADASSAIGLLRHAHRLDELARGLIARGRILCAAHQAGRGADLLELAREDLIEAGEIIGVGRLLGIKCRHLLLAAQLHRIEGDDGSAARAAADAAKLATELGLRLLGG